MLLEPPGPEIVRNEPFKAIFDEGFGRVPKSDFLVSGTPPAPKPSAGAAEPSHETAEPSADPARPSSETAKPRPAHGDRHVCRSLDQIRPARFTEIAPLCRSPAPSTRSPASQLRSPARTLRSPVAPHAREVGLKSARGAVLGFGVSTQKPREVILNTGGGQSQNCEAQAIWPISLKKRFPT